MQSNSSRGVAQLVARYVRDVEAARSSRVTPTIHNRIMPEVGKSGDYSPDFFSFTHHFYSSLFYLHSQYLLPPHALYTLLSTLYPLFSTSRSLLSILCSTQLSLFKSLRTFSAIILDPVTFHSSLSALISLHSTILAPTFVGADIL